MLPVQMGKQTFAAVHTGQGTATATAAALTADSWEVSYGVYIRNHDGANPMYVGGSNVTTGNGFRIVSGESLWIPIELAKNLWAVSGGSIAYSYMSI